MFCLYWVNNWNQSYEKNKKSTSGSFWKQSFNLQQTKPPDDKMFLASVVRATSATCPRPWLWALCKPHHDDVIKWKHFPRYWPFVRVIHRSLVNSPHKGQWRRALMFSLIRAWINGWVKNHEAGDLKRHRAHYDVAVMVQTYSDRPKSVAR